MAVTPKDYAKAFYLAVRGKSAREIEKGTKRLADVLDARGARRLLPQVLAALPAAMAEADADRRVTIESARPLDDKEVAAVLKAIGRDPDGTETTTRVDPALVGGVKIRLRDGTVDATVKGSLGRLKDAFRRAK
jgi:F-type H+-transporting ATPase subunit delta